VTVSFRDVEVRNAAGGKVAENAGIIRLPALIVPYALVVFALFNIMNVAFIFSVIGANLVWPIALYSSRTFAGNRISGTARRPTPENAPQGSMA
jgi:hypothetical protein